MSKYLLPLALLACPVHSQAVISLSGTWYSELGTGSNASVTAVNLITADADTLTLSFSGTGLTGTSRGGAYTALGESVSLTDVGDFLQFAGNYTGTIGNNTSYAIRVGFYNSNGLTINENSDADLDSTLGIFAAVGNRTSTGSNTGLFYHSWPANTGSQILGLHNANVDSNGILQLGPDTTVITTGSRLITFRIEKTAATTLTVSISDGNLLSYSQTVSTMLAPTTFDSLAVGFQMASNQNATLDNIEVTTVPEPSTFAILAGLAALGLVMWRRRR